MLKYITFQIAQYLLDLGSNINHSPKYDNPPLIRASQRLRYSWRRRNLSMIEFLVTNGANVQMPDKYGNTPLLLAIEGEILRLGQLQGYTLNIHIRINQVKMFIYLKKQLQMKLYLS